MANERRPTRAASETLTESDISVAHVMRTVCGLTEPAAPDLGAFSQVSDSSAWHDRRINGPSGAT